MPERTYDTLPDPADFRDRLFEPTLIDVPVHRSLEGYRENRVPILDQGREGACTGFALATVANYLLAVRKVVPDRTPVSARMLYEMAKRYDEWEGSDYSGSSARGAMKGWHKHGVCKDELAPYQPGQDNWALSNEHERDAMDRPLGAYYRVNHKDIISMHAAIAEVGILFATSRVHNGWSRVGADGLIKPSDELLGGHAFAIVGFDADGFWLQNSWGNDWGKDGFGLVTYDDWMENAMDVWVARLGAPVRLRTPASTAISVSAPAQKSKAYAVCDVRSHVVSIGNDGRLRSKGAYGTSEAELQRLFTETIPERTQGWNKRRILFYAHGGLVSESSAIERIMEYRPTLLENEVYPVGFVWKTDYWSTLKNILQDATRRRRPEGLLDSAKDFLLDRLDDALEPLARRLTGKLQWDEMKENAVASSTSADGGARLAAELAAQLAADHSNVEYHLIGHSAGSIFLGAFLQRMIHHQLQVSSGTLWAPACTMQFFDDHYLAPINDAALENFTLYTLTDEAERDDHCTRIYNKSLLYLVSNAFEDTTRIPILRPDGEPILGMAKFVEEHTALQDLIDSNQCDWITSPNTRGSQSKYGSRASSHGGFDDDQDTVLSTLKRILGASVSRPAMEFSVGASRRQSIRASVSAE